MGAYVSGEGRCQLVLLAFTESTSIASARGTVPIGHIHLLLSERGGGLVDTSVGDEHVECAARDL